MRLVLVTALAVVISGCSFNIGTNTATSNTNSNNTNKPAETAKTETAPAATSAAVPAKQDCSSFSMPGKVFVAKQSFPFDHMPYQGSCFVTFANKDDMVDAKDVPRGSKFYIYRDGKQLFEFPDAFGGQEACWVEAVSFKDLNGDKETDVVVAGSCLGAKAGYPTNAVYVNVGKGFITNEEANANLDEFKTIKQIEDYVTENKSDFFAE